MTDRSLAMHSPAKRAPQGKVQADQQSVIVPSTSVSQGAVIPRYCLCNWANTFIHIPQQGSSSLSASSVTIDAPVKKMLQPMWKTPLSTHEFCRFWEEDWPQLRALRIQAFKSCLTTLRSVDSAAIALLKDKLDEAQQCFTSAKLLRDNDQDIVQSCRQDALRDAALLGHASRKLLDPMDHLVSYSANKLSSHSLGQSSTLTDPDILERQVFRLQKQLFFKAFHLHVVYIRNMLRLSSAVILDNDNYMLLRGTLLTWHQLLRYKRSLMQVDNLVSCMVNAFLKRKYLNQWLSSLHTRVAVQKEKVLRQLLYDSISASNTSYPEPSILSSPSVIQPDPRLTASRSTESYLTRLYNIFIAIGMPLTPQNRSVLSLTDFSIVIGLISKLSRIRRKACTASGLRCTRHTREKLPIFTSLGEVLRSAQTGTDLEAFGAIYYTNTLIHKVFLHLRSVFYLHTMYSLAIIYSTYSEKSHIIRILSTGLSVQRQRILVARTRLILRVSFAHLHHAYIEAVNSKHKQANQHYCTMLISVAWRNIVLLAKKYTELNLQAVGMIERSICELKREAFKSFKLAYACNIFLEQHIGNRCNFRYRSLFWAMHRLTFQRRALRKVMWEISFPCYRHVIQLESYYASRSYQHDLCCMCIQHWREVSLQNQKALALQQLTMRADTFYSQKLTRFVMHLLLMKTKQKQESRLFFYRRQILLVRTAFRQWNIRLHQCRKVATLGTTLRELLDLYAPKLIGAIVTEMFHQWRILAKARYYHSSMLQRQAFHAFCNASVSLRYLHISDKQYQLSLMRRAYSTLAVLCQYQHLLAKLDKRYAHTLKQIGFSTLRAKYMGLIRDAERADCFYQHCLLTRICKALEYAAVRSRVDIYAHTVGVRYIKFFYLRRWKLSLRASREAIYLEKQADSFYKGLLDRWADKVLCGYGMKTDIPVPCLMSHTNRELLETGLLGSIVLSSKVLKAHLLYENQLLLVVFDEWRYAIIRRQRLISMRGPI
ncbi:hypothetical protein QR46_3368 [Giardia duodenalis assemblage B]|uniref:Uncharacterized protein n=1 Tax=Giardia duodenalis assemblage B TaxID=1394984 RepID=A0A132NR91_GIAIN|nr:hypothetical protein QR46_3368 [Giardia intestinalis assemblage B]